MEGDENLSASPAAAQARSVLGSLLFFVGVGVLGLLLIDPNELPAAMPRTWYVDRTLWVAGGLIAVGTGWYLLGDPQIDPESDQHGGARARNRARSISIANLGIPGPRFSSLVLYTRSGCHLCDDARAILDRYAAWLPPIAAVDIDADPNLVARFSTCVPVVELDGKVRFRGRVNEVLLRRLIAATPPPERTSETTQDTTRSGGDL
jgi:glutaredoxin